MSTPLPRRAMVLAAGLGKRMRPLTETRPKPLISVAGVTLLDRALDWLAASGIEEAVVNTHYLGQQITDHVKNRHKPRIALSPENPLLETGGGIKKALPLLGEGIFLSCNSDTICLNGQRAAPHRLAAAWDDAAMDALLLLHPVEKAVGYEGKGDFFLEQGKLRRKGAAASAPYVFTGVQLIHPRIFTGAPEGAFSMNLLYDRHIAPDGTLARIGALVHDGHWLHVGDPQGLAQAEAWLAAHS